VYYRPTPAGFECDRQPRAVRVKLRAPLAAPDRPMTADEVTQLIRAGLPDAEVRVLTDDDTHFEAVVIAPQFEGRRHLQRHQLVYATLGALMGGAIHALSIQAFTPDEWRVAQGQG
jgi:acid stress-induced BolA-like protein IbaG/YrbA